MRYIKLFLFVLIMFFIMLFFVQNMAAFSQIVTLHLDLMIFEPMISSPVPMYTILIMAFTFGGLVVLLMLIWDRLYFSSRFKRAASRVNTLEKKLAKSELTHTQYAETSAEKEKILNAEVDQLKLDLEETRQRLDEIRKNYNQ